MVWPTPQEYNEAIQTPLLCFEDQELRHATPELNALGLPRPNSGAFASVYKMTQGRQNWAVRCFLRNINDQQDRYARISDFVLSDDLPYTVDFTYLSHGIKIYGNWYPILKMDWVDGLTLDAYIRKHVQDRQCLRELLENFRTMHEALNKCGIAHGDLQHGNIIVTAEGELRLVDYDGMFVPALAGSGSNELGHPNYQHPGRNGMYFNGHLDRFSCWVIETSIRGIIQDPSLVHKLNACDDALLFRRNDFLKPLESPAFYLLESHADQEIRLYSRWLRIHTQQRIDEVPSPPEQLTEMPASAPRSAALLQQFDAGGDVDWQQLKQFYNLANLPRVLTEDSNLPAVNPVTTALERYRDVLRTHNQVQYQFGNLVWSMAFHHLQMRYQAKHLCVVWLVMILWTAAWAYTFPFLSWLGIAGMVHQYFWTRRLVSLYKKAAQTIMRAEPLDVILAVHRDSDGTTLNVRIERAPMGYKFLQASQPWDVPEPMSFDWKYGLSVTRVRCQVFVDEELGRPLGIWDNDHVIWLI